MQDYFERLNEEITMAYESVSHIEANMTNDKNLNLSINEIHLIQKIGEDGGRSIVSLADELRITKASVTVAVQKLERKGYVYKEKSDRDLRSVKVYLTEKGKRMDRVHNYFHLKMVRKMTESLTENEMKAILSALIKINGYLNRLDEKEQK